MKKMIVAVIIAVAVASSFVLLCTAGSCHQDDWKEYIENVCVDRQICPELVEAIIEQESSWDPHAVNGTCVGLMQIDQTCHWARMQGLGVADLTDPYENILTGVDILEELFYKYEDPAAVLMFYNAGYSDKLGLGAYRRGEISDYALQVLERSAELERLHGK